MMAAPCCPGCLNYGDCAVSCRTAPVPHACQNGRKTAGTTGHSRAPRTISDLDMRRLTPSVKRPSKQPVVRLGHRGASIGAAVLTARAKPEAKPETRAAYLPILGGSVLRHLGVVMKIFLSWSGEKSKALAETLRDWLPDVVQSVEPFVSTQDISIGDRPLSVLASELEATSFGIVCVTQQNKLTPWITFEAGALSKIVDTSKVIPLLLDLKVSDLTGPLSQFQAVDAGDEMQVFKLIKAIAAASPPPPISESRLKRTFDAFWSTLHEAIKELRQQRSEDIEENARSDRDILEELLDLARRNDRGIVNVINRDMASSSSTHRALEIVSQLRSEKVPFEYSTRDNDLHINFAQNFTGSDGEPQAIDSTRLRAIMEVLARIYSTPIYVDNGPFGKEAFPPF
jgi:hypothetical protein